MILEIVVVGPLAVNCLIIGCEQTKIGAIIDPGDETAVIVKAVEELGLDIKYILLTHGHVDHLAEVQRLKDKFDAEFLMHEADSFLVQRASTQASMYGLSNPGNPEPSRYLTEGDTISVGELKIEVFHTPGHSPGSISYFVDDKLFVGDLIFSGSIGRTDLPGGNYEQLIQSVETKIFTKPDSTEIYPGHGPSTTVGGEKATNPFFNR